MRATRAMSKWWMLILLFFRMHGSAAPSEPADFQAINRLPSVAPRVFITPENRQRFINYCLRGDGKGPFNALKAEFDQKFLKRAFPAEPENYGDSNPLKRDSDKADKWRAAQATCNDAAGTAEAATILWIVTGDAKYLVKARDFLIKACQWNPAGTTGIAYNDEAHFRLWRKLPFVYDQLRGQLSAEERNQILASFRVRGNNSFNVVYREANDVRPNSLESEVASHGVRFVSMTGVAGLALYDDLAEARQWLAFALKFYASQFTPWGGEDGGWGEGSAYWRGNIEHGRFQDALFLIHHPDAWQNPYWKNTGYFPLYFVATFPTTQFGDTPSAGKLRLEPQMANFIQRLARHFHDGYLLSYANELPPAAIWRDGLNISRPNYPSGMEFLLQDFAGSTEPAPPPRSLSKLPSCRWFRDVGWVAFHSDLSDSSEDIMLAFKSSPYASYSHSHADQNAFILNAYGENLAINAGYREFHRSPHHKGYTRQTISKNDILIDGHGQLAQSSEARGKITRFDASKDVIMATGDATEAYNSNFPDEPVIRATRDVAFIGHRYFILRDVIKLKRAAPVSWLLHAEKSIQWDSIPQRAVITEGKARLLVQLIELNNSFKTSISREFPVPFDPKYKAQGYTNQVHLTATSTQPATTHVIFAIMWPDRGPASLYPFAAHLLSAGSLMIQRPDGLRDRIGFDEVRISSNR